MDFLVSFPAPVSFSFRAGLVFSAGSSVVVVVVVVAAEGPFRVRAGIVNGRGERFLSHELIFFFQHSMKSRNK